jgi:oxepin-CoA hydrolase/3-oxo-5,6-dehydrosuberyl-CoA semialdehyde dehydrogenase
VVGNPRNATVTMGAHATRNQRVAVLANVARLLTETDRLFGDPERCAPLDADDEKGAFLSPLLLATDRPLAVSAPHELEAFGPVSTLMAYDSIDDAIEVVRRGAGSLVASVFTYDDDAAHELIFGISAYHGRIIAIDRDDAREQTGHGSPLPALTHGGPGRAGGGEELGGVRGVFHYMQRTAIQASPARLAALTKTWTSGAPERSATVHPFRRTFDELQVGETIHTPPRTVTLADIEHFAEFTGDKFYAHMDEAAARANPFFEGRVAHGYLILAFAAGLFVDPAPGPVLANYGLERLRFLKPVAPGDAIAARLTVRSKSARRPDYGEVHWDVAITNQRDELVAGYELLTMNATDAGAAALTPAS